MAHIEKQPAGRWRARYRTPDGRARSRTFDKKVDTERFIIGIERSKLMGGYVVPSAGQVSFRTFASQWRAVQLHRPGTAIAAEHQLRLHVYGYIGRARSPPSAPANSMPWFITWPRSWRGRPHPDLPGLRRVGQGPRQGRCRRVGDAARSAPLLR